MRGLFNRHFWKFLVGFLAIMIVGFFALVWANVYHNGKTADEKTGEKYFKDLKRAYDEDTYGGKTPEETLALFIDALKKGDIDLAVKYVLIEKQDDMKNDLNDAKNSNRVEKVIQNLASLRLSKLEENNATFTVIDSNNIVKYQAYLVKAPNSIWKILDL